MMQKSEKPGQSICPLSRVDVREPIELLFAFLIQAETKLVSARLSATISGNRQLLSLGQKAALDRRRKGCGSARWLSLFHLRKARSVVAARRLTLSWVRAHSTTRKIVPGTFEGSGGSLWTAV